jgi:hypothetical protein
MAMKVAAETTALRLRAPAQDLTSFWCDIH